MAKTRIELQTIFEQMLGTRSVYFQPPESVKMHFPCIRYQIDGSDNKNANNKKYIHLMKYTVTYIDEDPDSSFPNKIENMPYASFDRFYTSDGLNHWVFSLYY